MSIRNRLDRISRSNVRINLKVKMIADLGVKVLPPPPQWRRLAGRKDGRLTPLPINCFTYALGLQNSEPYLEGLKPWFDGHRVAIADSDFMRWFLTGRTERPPNKNDLIIYFWNSVPLHAGIVVGPDQVQSKWGLFAEIFEHRVWHVPRSYGTEVKYFKSVPFQKAEADFFRDY